MTTGTTKSGYCWHVLLADGDGCTGWPGGPHPFHGCSKPSEQHVRWGPYKDRPHECLCGVRWSSRGPLQARPIVGAGDEQSGIARRQ